MYEKGALIVGVIKIDGVAADVCVCVCVGVCVCVCVFVCVCV
jgi:hypothetical protein